jgi:hypothetical protein
LRDSDLDAYDLAQSRSLSDSDGHRTLLLLFSTSVARHLGVASLDTWELVVRRMAREPVISPPS